MSDLLTLQFSTTVNSWANRWSALIRRANHSPFSHVDLVLDDGNLLGASDSPDSPIIEGNPRGVAIRPSDYQEFGYRRRMLLRTYRADDITAIWKTQLGKGFDNSGIFTFFSDAFPGQRDWRLDSTWVCAELAAWSMEVGGFWQPKPLAWPKNRVSPTDLLLVCLMDDRWINRDAFWLPVPGLKLGAHER